MAGRNRIPQLEIRDWPLMAIRGSIEGFYGIPWSHQARLDHFAFYGRHKLNTYIYTPKDDLLLRSKWRELYAGDALEKMRELVEAATRNHVHFTFALSPGNDITYSSQQDLDATIKKFEQVRALGVTSFYIALDDIPRTMNKTDAQQFSSLGQAQAHYLNRVQREYVEQHGLEALQTVPTEYTGSKASAYKTAFGTALDPDVRVQWTGEGVFAAEVTAASAKAARAAYHTEHLYLWDNFPVNDDRRDRLFLKPVEGRAANLHEYLDGFTSNPMIEPYASLPGLATYADYCWNPPHYDPDASYAAALDELAGPDQTVRRALDVFVDLNVHWPYAEGSPAAPKLSADVESYWRAYDRGERSGRVALRQRLNRIIDLPRTLEAMDSQGFVNDTLPWMVAASQWAQGLKDLDRMLTALEAGRTRAASQAAASARKNIAAAGVATVPDQKSDGVRKENQIIPMVGDGVFEAFVVKAWAQLRDVLPDDPSLPLIGLPAKVSTTLEQYKDYPASRMVDGDESTFFWAKRWPRVGDTITLELESVADVRHVEVRMARSDTTPGDQVYFGDVELSIDGKTWTKIGSTNQKPIVAVTLPQGQRAKFARLRVTRANPAGQWVQVREFVVADRTPPSA